MLGPGLGYTAQSMARAAETRTLVQTLLPGFAGSAVLDADGLNAAADLLQAGKTLHPRGELILTPHPGEMARLTGLSAAAIHADREGTAQRFARAWNAVVVLKGAQTVIAAPDGRCAVNPTGNPGLSRGGSGDVLAGMTSALLACGLPAFEAAVCAVYLHGSDLCTKYVENELNNYKIRLNEVENNIRSYEIEFKTVSKNLSKLNKEKDWTEDIFHSVSYSKTSDNIKLSTLDNSKSELNSNLSILRDEHDILVEKIEELTNILKVDKESTTQKSIDKNESTQDNVSRETINSDTLDNQLIEQITSLINKQKFIIQIMDKDITRSKLEINNSIILMERLIEKVKKDI